MSEQYPTIYPLHESWDDHVRSTLPDVAANGDGAGFAQALARPLGDLDDQAALLYAALTELGDASGTLLDLRGDLVGEPRGGLSDGEYRRIIAGRLVAVQGGVTGPRVRAGWTALVGTEDVDTIPLVPMSWSLSARVDWTPSGLYLVRVGAVVQANIGADCYADAVLSRSGTAIFDNPLLGFDAGTWAYSMPVGP